MPPNERLIAAAKSKPMDADAFEIYLTKAPDKHERIGMATGKAVLKLPDDYHQKEPFINPTPGDFRRISIERAGAVFNLVSMGSRIPILPGDRQLYRFPDDLKTTDLTLEEAVTNGRRIEQLIKQKE